MRTEPWQAMVLHTPSRRSLSVNVSSSIDYQLAKTYEPGNRQARKHLTAAANSYAALYETYRTRAAGLLARLWEGRCYQELGDYNQALGCYRDLMDLADSDETRTITVSETGVVEREPIPVIVMATRCQVVEPRARGQPP